MVQEQNNKNNVTLGKGALTGVVWFAPMGTTVPTDATSQLPSDYINVGYIGDDGVTESHKSDNTTVNDMNGTQVINTISSYSTTFKFPMLEVKADAFKLIYGDDAVTVKENGDFEVREHMPTARPVRLVFEFVLDDGRVERQVVANATLSDIDDIQHHSGDPVMMTVTMSANPSDELGGDSVRTYVATPTAAASNSGASAH